MHPPDKKGGRAPLRDRPIQNRKALLDNRARQPVAQLAWTNEGVN
jgi:hypothetical protein